MNGTRIAAVAFAASLALFTAGCDRTNEATENGAAEVGQADTPASGGSAGSVGTTLRDTADRAGQAIDDAAVTTAVKGKYLADDTLKGLDISVDTERGTVTLTGAVQDDAAKQRATEIAQGVEGVVNVDNRLTIQGSDDQASTDR